MIKSLLLKSVPFDLNLVAVHELGHFAGLDHPDDQDNLWEYEKKPSIMLKSYSHTTNFSGYASYSASRNATPLGDDLLGIRNHYVWSTPYIKDGAVNQWEYPDQNDGFTKPRNQRLFNNTGLSIEVCSNCRSRGGWGGFTPVSVHNLGTTSNWIGGRVRLRQTSINGKSLFGGAGNFTVFGATIPPGGYYQGIRSVNSPSTQQPAGPYLLETQLVGDYTYDGDTRNNIDRSYKRYYHD